MVFKDSLVLGKIGTSPALVVHKDSIKVKPPRNYPGSNLDWYRQKAIYSELESNQPSIAFHAGEIWEIRYAELLLGKGSFGKTLQFITNYGRDNYTVAAVAGMILGARDGHHKLPEDLKLSVMKTNKDLLGIDLLPWAQELTEMKYPGAIEVFVF